MTFGPQMKSPRVINYQVKESGKKLPSTPRLLGPHEIHVKCVNASDYDLNYVQRLLPSALRSFLIVKLEAVEERPSHHVSNSIWEKNILLLHCWLRTRGCGRRSVCGFALLK